MHPAVPAAAPALPSVSLRLWQRIGRRGASLAGDAMFRKSLLSIADQGVVSATNFAITIILSRLCGKPEVGLYYLALQVFFFARGVQEQLIASPYLVYGSRKQGSEAARYAGSTLAHELVLLVAVALSLGIAAAYGGASPELSQLLWLLVGAAPLMLIREFIRQFSFAQLKVAQALALDCGVAALQISAIAAAAYLGMLTAPFTYTLLAIGCGVSAIAWLVLRRGTFATQSAAIWPDWVHNWRFGRWALASLLLGQTMPLVLPWIVAGTHGEASAATYGVSATLIGFANMYVLGLSNFICPRAAQAYASGGPRELVGVLKQASLMHLSALVPFALAMLFAGQTLMTFVYGPTFADAGLIIAVLAFGAIANSLSIVAGNGLWAMELPSANFRGDVCAMLTWIAATAVLVPQHGPLGAAVASTIGMSVGAMVRGTVLVSELCAKKK
jgi:O-antigen/teichoic acid export membrane protein